MSNSIAYLTSRSNFLQVSPEVPVTKQRNPEKFDPPDIFEGVYIRKVVVVQEPAFLNNGLQQTRRNW